MVETSAVAACFNNEKLFHRKHLRLSKNYENRKSFPPRMFYHNIYTVLHMLYLLASYNLVN